MSLTIGQDVFGEEPVVGTEDVKPETVAAEEFIVTVQAVYLLPR
jgi:hypothetical protein